MSRFVHTKFVSTVSLAPQFNIGDIERGAREAIRSVSDQANAVIQNTVGDIEAIFGAASECLANIDEIRVRITNRVIDYHTLVVRTLTDGAVLPIQLIEDVWRVVAPDLIRNPNPRLFQLRNPRAAVWGSHPPDFVQVTDPAAFDPERQSFVFVHGKDYLADPNDVYHYMYTLFEREVRLFNEGSGKCDDLSCAVYLLTYDSKLTDEVDTIIRKGFETVLGGVVTGTAPALFLAVLWRELERRARLTGDYLYSLLSSQPRGADNPWFLFSHSLGCFVVAHMANRIYSEHWSDGGIFRSWYCMAAALPANAFSRTGMFPYAPLLTRGEANTTSVYYSFLDDVLSTAYILANNHLAMGNVGFGIQHPENILRDYNTTGLSREIHTATGGYFSRIGGLIRRDFGIHNR